MSRAVRLTGRREDTDIVLTNEIADKVKFIFFFVDQSIIFYTKL
jgi:hypothetical protein